jgi:flagellar hook assembly protein FlgD
VYNVAGQLVCTLVDGVVEAGVVHETTWRGLNNNGSPVASGVYFCRLVASDFVQTKKMVLLQ